MNKTYKNVTFNGYTGKNPQIREFLQKEFDVFVDTENRLNFCKNGNIVFKTSAIAEENSFRSFEFQNYNFVTQSGTGYSIAINKKDPYSGSF